MSVNRATLCELPLSRHDVEPVDCARAAAFLRKTNYGQHDLNAVCDAWPQLIRTGVLNGVLVEDATRRLVSLGMSVFVKATVLSQLSGASFAAARVMTAALGLVATPTDVARANAGDGLHVFIIHSGVAEVDAEDRHMMPAIKAQLMKGFMDLHAGYNIRRIMVEAYGDEERSMYVEGSRFSILHQHEAPHENGVGLNKGPYLLGLDRHDVLAMPMHPLLPLFSPHAEPRCAFRDHERALLIKALRGHTDLELARELGVSIYTVKKRWVGILERAERCTPCSLIGGTERGERGRRGLQRRHLLLRYLRNHPEELTPYSKGHEPGPILVRRWADE